MAGHCRDRVPPPLPFVCAGGTARPDREMGLSGMQLHELMTINMINGSEGKNLTKPCALSNDIFRRQGLFCANLLLADTMEDTGGHHTVARKHRALLPSLAASVAMTMMVWGSTAGAESLVRSDNNSLDAIPDDIAHLTDESLIDPPIKFDARQDTKIVLRPWDAAMDKKLTKTAATAPVPIKDPTLKTEGQGIAGGDVNPDMQDAEEEKFMPLGRHLNGVPVRMLLTGFDNALQRPDEELECLAYTLYFEARGESVGGQRAVANVILNRQASPHYPDTICGVTRQGGYGRYQCQFTYRCDGLEDNIHEVKAYYAIKRLAHEILNATTHDDATHGATHYHTINVRPDWASNLTRTTRIGSHIFYKG